MGSVASTIDRSEDLIPLCRQLAADEAHFDAVVIRNGDHLHCFVATRDIGFEPMTLQIGYEEQPMRFEATPTVFALHCLPAMVGKLGLLAAPRIAFIDAEFSWSHEELLRDWSQSQEETRGSRRASSISIQTYLSIPDEPLVPDSQVVRNAAQETEVRRMASAPAARKRGSTLGAPTTRDVTAIHPGSEVVSTASLDDVPAEFDQIVWKVFAPVRRNGDAARGWEAAVADGRCFTTRELAERLYPNPSWQQLVAVFHELRREEGSSVQVPMVGFERDWLYTKGYLGQWDTSNQLSISDDEFSEFRRHRYLSVNIGSQRHKGILLSARRCLKSAAQGLRLFDLAEDVICDLTGRADTRLSLSDVYRLYDQMRGEVERVRPQESDPP